MLEYKGNVAPPDAKEDVKGLWNVYEVDGKSSLQEHVLKTVWQSCPKNECYFELTDSLSRECTCTKCGGTMHFVLGMSRLVDGKIITIYPVK